MKDLHLALGLLDEVPPRLVDFAQGLGRECLRPAPGLHPAALEGVALQNLAKGREMRRGDAFGPWFQH